MVSCMNEKFISMLMNAWVRTFALAKKSMTLCDVTSGPIDTADISPIGPLTDDDFESVPLVLSPPVLDLVVLKFSWALLSILKMSTLFALGFVVFLAFDTTIVDFLRVSSESFTRLFNIAAMRMHSTLS